MTNANRRLPLLLLVAVAALVLGSVGTATAQGLTTKTVKKIATKVVRKQARHLHVADADTVGGLGASALDERRTVYTFAVADQSNIEVRLPIQPGSYEISYSVRLKGAVATSSACFIGRYNSVDVVQYVGDDGSTAPGNFGAHSGSGVVTFATGERVALNCLADNNVSTTAVEPGQIVVTPLAGVTSQPLTAVTGP